MVVFCLFNANIAQPSFDLVYFSNNQMPTFRAKGKKNKLKPSENLQARCMENWSGRKMKTVDNAPLSYFYSIPNSMLLTLLIVISIIVSVVFLVIFKLIFKTKNEDGITNATVGSYLALVALPVGVVLAFIIASAWSSFSDAQSKENQEATQILVLFNAVKQISGSESVLDAIEEYTAFVIDVEFPLGEKGVQSQEGTTMLFNIGDMIYALDPEGTKEEIIYGSTIDIYESVVALRIARMGYIVDGLAPELWWVLVLGVVVVIIVSYFIYASCLFLQAIMTALTITALVSMLFLIVALNFPYRGDFGLDSLPFQIALFQMQLRD